MAIAQRIQGNHPKTKKKSLSLEAGFQPLAFSRDANN